jgi:hypothetical protein
MRNDENDRASNLDTLAKLDHVKVAPEEPNSSPKPQDRANERLAWRIDDFCRAIGLGRSKVYAMIG